MQGKSPNRRQAIRFLDIQDRGCVPCFLEARFRGREWTPEPCDIHHTDGGDNHDATYGNCPWHHRGVPKYPLVPAQMHEIFGPSMARSPNTYRERYGDEKSLLALQNGMLLQSVASLLERADGSRTRQGYPRF